VTDVTVAARASHYGTALNHYYAVRFASWLVDYLILTGVPLLGYALTGDLIWSGIALAFAWAPRILSLGAAGYLVDRLPTRRLCLVGDGIRLVSAASCAGLIALRPTTAVWVVLGFSVVVGVVFEQTFVAGEKLGRVLAEHDVQPRVQAVLTGLEQVAVIVAPAMCGLLLLLPPAMFLATAGLLYGVSFLFTLRLPTDAATHQAPSESQRTSLLVGLRNIIADPVLRGAVILTMGLNYMLGLINGGAAAVVDSQFGVSTSALSFVYAAGNVISVAVLGLAPCLIRRLGLWRFGSATALIAPLPCLVIGVTPTFTVFGLCLGVFLALDALFSVYIRTARAQRVPTAVYGSTVAAFGLLAIVPLPLAGLTLTAIGPHLDTRLAFSAAAVGSLVIVVLVIPLLARNSGPNLGGQKK
jgi:hypothetical protein